MSYNPNQPRDPKGEVTGGQWTGDKTIDAARKAAGLSANNSERFNAAKSKIQFGKAGDALDDATRDAVIQGLAESNYYIDKPSSIRFVRIHGSPLDSASGRGLHAAAFSLEGRSAIFNIKFLGVPSYQTWRIPLKYK
jgi:hypothetical protein